MSSRTDPPLESFYALGKLDLKEAKRERKKSNSPVATYRLGRAYFEVEMYAEAEKEFVDALRFIIGPAFTMSTWTMLQFEVTLQWCIAVARQRRKSEAEDLLQIAYEILEKMQNGKAQLTSRVKITPNSLYGIDGILEMYRKSILIIKIACGLKSVEVSNLVRKPTRVPVETLISDKERKTRYIRKEVQSCLEMGLLERAEDVLRKHLEKESSDTWGWKRLAEVMQEAGNVKEEAKALQKFLFFEKDADAYLRFGILLKELGKTDASEQALARAVKMKPSLTKKVKSLQETE